MRAVIESVQGIFERGGPVMWPLLAMSLVAVALIVERSLFWLSVRGAGRRRWVLEAADRLRAGDEPSLRAMIARDRTLYGRVIGEMLTLPPHPGLAVEMAERHRHEAERFLLALSSCITAAPLLGILGTVTGIIKSFDLLGRSGRIVEIEAVATGIAEALITTAFGLTITLVVLFPYMHFRGRVERVLSDIEQLSAARLGWSRGKPIAG